MYSFESRVRYSECDEHSRLTTPGLINYLQDCSLFHTEELGHGVRYVAQKNYAWFIAAWQIQIDRRPVFGQRIVVSTWSYKMTTTLASRCFSIVDSNGETLVKADSLWFVFDTLARRPIRVPSEEYVYLSDDEPIDLPPTVRKLRLFGEGEPQRPVEVSQEHLDTNLHVNNGQYVAIADHAIRRVDNDFDPYRILVQYKQAAMLGDLIVPHLYTEDTGYAVDLVSPTGQSYAVVRMECRAQ